MNCLRICQKDAQESVSPLRVRIRRVVALRTRFAMVLEVFRSYGRSYGFYENLRERCARVGFPPSGSYQASCGSADSFYNGFLAVFDFTDL